MNGRQRGNTAPSGDGPHGGRMGNQLHIVAAVEEQGSGGQESIAGKPVRSRWKRGEPHGREQGATNLHGRRGASRRGGEKPRGRNAVDAWQRRPDGGAVATSRNRELTLRTRATEGHLWKTPREEFRCLRHRNARTRTRRKRGGQGHEGGFAQVPQVPERPWWKVVEDRRCAARACRSEKIVDGGGKPTCRDFSQVSPPQA